MYKTTDQTETLDRLNKAMKRQHPVTISYIRADGNTTVRTIEIFEIPKTLTNDGNQIIRAMDRETGQTRTWRLDRIVSYTVHRTHYVVPRCPEHKTNPEECFEQGKHNTWCDEHDMSESDCYLRPHKPAWAFSSELEPTAG